MYKLPAKLTHTEVAQIPQEFWQSAPQKGIWTIDFSHVKEIDSAFLALLLEILKKSNMQKLSLKLKGLHQNTIDLLKVYGIYSLFEKAL